MTPASHPWLISRTLRSQRVRIKINELSDSSSLVAFSRAPSSRFISIFEDWYESGTRIRTTVARCQIAPAGGTAVGGR